MQTTYTSVSSDDLQTARPEARIVTDGTSDRASIYKHDKPVESYLNRVGVQAFRPYKYGGGNEQDAVVGVTIYTAEGMASIMLTPQEATAVLTELAKSIGQAQELSKPQHVQGNPVHRNCPACKADMDNGVPFTVTPASETYWSS